MITRARSLTDRTLDLFSRVSNMCVCVPRFLPCGSSGYSSRLDPPPRYIKQVARRPSHFMSHDPDENPCLE